MNNTLTICPTCRRKLPETSGIWIDGLSNNLVLNGKIFSLSSTERKVMNSLITRSPQFISYKDLSQQAYGEKKDNKIINGVMSRLRSKLMGTTIHLDCRWGFGYRLIKEN